MVVRVLTFLMVCMMAASQAHAFNYIEPNELKLMLEEKKPVILVDIQPAAAFEKQHLPGAVETNAYPAKSDADRNKLAVTLEKINGSSAPVVIICPRGGSGAANSYTHLLTLGIPEQRLRILRGGNDKWPYPELFVKGR